jgi:SM-20-related protein
VKNLKSLHQKKVVNYLNQVCYAGVNDFEFHYTHYASSTFYKKHLDRFSIDDSRMFSVIFYLNKNWNSSHGGNLKIYKDNGKKVKIIKK